MRLSVALVLLAGLASSAHAADIAGRWRAEYVSGVAWQTIGSAEFDFDSNGDKLTGTAHVGLGWPGTAPIPREPLRESAFRL